MLLQIIDRFEWLLADFCPALIGQRHNRQRLGAISTRLVQREHKIKVCALRIALRQRRQLVGEIEEMLEGADNACVLKVRVIERLCLGGWFVHDST